MFVFVSSDLGCAISAYGCAVSSKAVPVVVPIDRAAELFFVWDTIFLAISGQPQCVVFFGDIWGNTPELVHRQFGCGVLVVPFDQHTLEHYGPVTGLVENLASKKPTDVIKSVIFYYTLPGGRLFTRAVSPDIETYINDYCLGGLESAQRISTGVLYSTLPDGYQPRYPELGNRFGKHLALCEGALTLDAAGRRGDELAEPFRQLVRERIVLDITKTVLDDHICVVSSGSEFINMQHQELHSMYPLASLTVVRCPRGRSVAYTLRSWDNGHRPAPDANKIAAKFGGNGSATAASWMQKNDLLI